MDNGDKIQKLYLSTFEAERSAAEVERRLASVESQQDELSSVLDEFERKVDGLFEKGGMSNSDGGLQGPDQERERVYKSAERLEERLEEMMRDLSGMISEVNEASASLSKTSKVDDPVSLAQYSNTLSRFLANLLHYSSHRLYGSSTVILVSCNGLIKMRHSCKRRFWRRRRQIRHNWLVVLGMRMHRMAFTGALWEEGRGELVNLLEISW